MHIHKTEIGQIRVIDASKEKKDLDNFFPQGDHKSKAGSLVPDSLFELSYFVKSFGNIFSCTFGGRLAISDQIGQISEGRRLTHAVWCTSDTGSSSLRSLKMCYDCLNELLQCLQNPRKGMQILVVCSDTRWRDSTL